MKRPLRDVFLLPSCDDPVAIKTGATEADRVENSGLDRDFDLESKSVLSESVPGAAIEKTTVRMAPRLHPFAEFESEGSHSVCVPKRDLPSFLFDLGVTTSQPSLAISGELDITN